MVAAYLPGFVLLCVTGLAAAADVRVTVSADNVELGKYLTAQVSYTGSESRLPASYYQWEQNFYIDRGDVATRNLPDGDILTTEKLRLYPLRTGRIVVDSIALGGGVSHPLDISVRDSVRNGISGTPRWHKLPQRLWQGQSVQSCISSRLFAKSNVVRVADWHLEGFAFRPLPVRKTLVNDINVIEQCWQITAYTEGEFKLFLPAVEQKGRGRWRYYLPAQSLQVMPVPGYIPATVPVGNLRAETSLVHAQSGELWQISFYSDSVLQAEIYKIRQQLAQLAGISADSVQVKLVDNSGLSSVMVYSSVLPEWSFGSFSNHSITMSFFSPQQEKVITQQINLPAVWRMPLWFVLMSISIIAITLILVVKNLRRFVSGFINMHRFRRALAATQTPDELRALLLRQCALKQHMQVKSLADWSDCQNSSQTAEIAQKLNQLCFSNRPDADFSGIKEQLLRIYII